MENLVKDAPNLYVTSVLDLYLGLPETPTRVSRTDRKLALDLHQRGIPRSTIEAALLLASVRRLCRPPHAPPLSPIRSLHYFLPVIEEIIHQPLPAGYLNYLRHKLATHGPHSQPSNDPRTTP